MTVWFLADPHWGHEFVAKLRGFDNAHDHDVWLMSECQARFAPGDSVWWLGDLAIRDQQYGINSCIETNPDALHHVIFGNHDAGHPMHRRAYRHFDDYRLFESASPFARRRIPTGQDRTDALLSHFPYAGGGDHTDEERYTQWRLPDVGTPLIHGHTHSTEKVSYTPAGTIQVHVGVDAWLRPVSLTEVTDIITDTDSGTDLLVQPGKKE